MPQVEGGLLAKVQRIEETPKGRGVGFRIAPCTSITSSLMSGDAGL
jgi:hypothetical protein